MPPHTKVVGRPMGDLKKRQVSARTQASDS